MKITIYTKRKVYNFNTRFDKKYKYALGHAHREDGPAYIKYYEAGNIYNESWYLNGKRHRKNGPAYIEYTNSHTAYEKWQVNGKLHRVDGPAIIWYNDNGKIENKDYYLNNKYYSKTEFNQEILKKKLQLF